jgi:uncharacterized phage-associated protein
MANSTTQQRPTAEQVARYLIKIANEEQERILQDGDDLFPKDTLSSEQLTHLKLQKLLYFAQAVNLAVKKQPLFDDKFEAWKLGPVSREVYTVFANFKNKPIPSNEGSDVGLDDGTKELLNEVWKTFGKFSAPQLVDMTHRHTPWLNAVDTKDKIIDEGEMITFYTPLFVSDDQPVSS